MSTESLLHTGVRLSHSASTEEFADLNSPHWAVEPFIPITTAEMVTALLARKQDWVDTAPGPAVGHAGGMPNPETLAELYWRFGDLLHHQYRPLFGRFAQSYAAIDPDRDTRHVIATPGQEVDKVADDGDAAHIAAAGYAATEGDESQRRKEALSAVARITEAGRIVLNDAGYTEVGRPELELAIGSFSHWGVPLHVDFDVFDAIVVYARGDIVGKRAKRTWQNLYRETFLDVALYQRVVVMFKLREGVQTDDQLDDQMLHLRMFKNIPKQDIDMLLPGTRVRFSWIDHFRNLVPSIGGIGVTLFKIVRTALFVAAITVSIAAVLIGLMLALIGYGVRSVMNHKNAKNRYMLNLTRSLYYQKLDSNAGVAVRLLDEAETQRHREVILAYHAIRSAGDPISRRRLRRRVERFVREMVDVEIAYRDGDAVATLDRWGLVNRNESGDIQVLPPADALRRMSSYWEETFGA